MSDQHPLRQWRLANNVSLSAAARAVGIDRATWRNWETGSTMPQMRLLPKVIKLTGLKLEQFMGAG